MTRPFHPIETLSPIPLREASCFVHGRGNTRCNAWDANPRFYGGLGAERFSLGSDDLQSRDYRLDTLYAGQCLSHAW
jgi:hypothetical protein